MFLHFFYQLRAHGIKVSTTEWLSLLAAVVRGFDRASLTTFYNLSRALLVKREGQYDAFDRAFAQAFEGIESNLEISDELLSWLDQPVPLRELTDEEKALMEAMDIETLREELKKRLAEQKERHDGGNRFVGTGGTSPFGQGGQNPAGVRVGTTGGGGRTAVGVASERRFQNLRSDRVLDTRQIGVALRKLRKLARDQGPEELDLDESVDRSAKNADIELVFAPPKKNRVKLLLLMDVGGSMDPFAQLSEQLFSAAHHATHFNTFKSYYFHNCVYEKLYTNIERHEGVFTRDVLATLDRTWTVVFVGDAWMSPYELSQDGSYFSYSQPKTAGIDWLKRIAEKTKAQAWMNPEPRRIWNAPTVKAIGHVFPMFELTLDGLDRAVDHLRGAKPVSPG
jgi:uncharacterized protein with von Willebrand factor type A (vWA) domain